MPRKKPIEVVATPQQKTAEEAWAEVKAGIYLLLVSANESERVPEAERSPLAREILAALTEVRASSGKRKIHYLRWPLSPSVAYDNLANVCEAGWRHLGRCRLCSMWFLSTDPRRTSVCSCPSCRKTAKRERDAANRRVRDRLKPAARSGVKDPT